MGGQVPRLVAAHRSEIGDLLLRASDLTRAAAVPVPKGEPARGRKRAGAGRARKKGLRGADLIGADLRGADLRVADLIGADLRGADLGGADLTGSLFLTRSQLNAADGDAATGLPASLERPAHWATDTPSRPTRP